jgi:hypothetical protein
MADDPLEKRVDTIERRVDMVDLDVSGLRTRVENIEENLRQDIKDLRHELGDRLTSIDEAVRQTTVQNLKAWPPGATAIITIAGIIIGALIGVIAYLL